jgi:hypothetical protein
LTGASMIGRLINPNSAPNKTDSRQIGAYDPNFPNTTAPNVEGGLLDPREVRKPPDVGN